MTTTDAGIYRYLNNPENWVGQAGMYGIALMASSWSVFFLSIFSHLCHLLFIRYVETPHMHRIYGDKNVRKDGPITTTVKKSLNTPLLRELASSLHALDQSNDVIKEKAAENLSEVSKRLQTIKNEYVGKIKKTMQMARRQKQVVLQLLEEETQKLKEKARALEIVRDAEGFLDDLKSIPVDQ